MRKLLFNCSLYSHPEIGNFSFQLQLPAADVELNMLFFIGYYLFVGHRRSWKYALLCKNNVQWYESCAMSSALSAVQIGLYMSARLLLI
jgi:hypothetical protein